MQVEAAFFDAAGGLPERNARRQRVVPADVLAKMAAKLAPPTVEEGFTKVTVV